MRTGEKAFDRQTGYKRDKQESFMYCHAMKNGSVEDIREQARLRVEQEMQRRQEQKELEKVQQQEKQQMKEVPEQRRSRGIGR